MTYFFPCPKNEVKIPIKHKPAKMLKIIRVLAINESAYSAVNETLPITTAKVIMVMLKLKFEPRVLMVLAKEAATV